MSALKSARDQLNRPALQPVDHAALQKAFERFGHRPQFFMAALGQGLSPFVELARHGGRFEHALLQAASDASNGNEARGRCRWVSAVRADAQVDELVLIQARGSPCALTVTVLPGGRVICTRYSWPRKLYVTSQ